VRGVSIRFRSIPSWLCAALALIALIGPGRAAAQTLRDTVAVHLEDGAGVDVTNELYYEDAFIDTTFLGRRLRGTPETRFSRLVSLSVDGTRDHRSTSYSLRHELTLGDLLQGGALGLTWRRAPDSSWRIQFDPSLEYRHDRTFDRDLEEWRAALGARVRRVLDDEVTAAEFSTLADVARYRGDGDAFLLDRNGARLCLSLDRLPLAGPDWRLEYRLTGRAFPDSADRDHLEHGWDGRLRHSYPAGWVLVETEGVRRQTVRVVPTSRDNYWEATGAVESGWRLSEAWVLSLGGEVEAIRYDVQDSILFFDYQIVRGRLDLKRESGAGWLVTFGPRVERLNCELNPTERYLESGAALELEFAGRRSWWSVEPAAGWREYDDLPDAIVAGYPTVHSSYAFYELSALMDQPLPLRLRLRGLTTLRAELHTDGSQDAFSTYASMQLRWMTF
jgi:hypothetical protein